MSAPPMKYVRPVAPGIAAQAAPEQRSHWRAYEMGWVPCQTPSLPVSVAPSLAKPEIVGAARFRGGWGGGGGRLVTAPVWSLFAEPEPALLLAVTRTRIVRPMSAAASL